MTPSDQIKKHLRSGALYLPASPASIGNGWKRRLLNQYEPKPLPLAGITKQTDFYRIFKILSSICIPILCIALLVAEYSGYLPLSQFILNIDWQAWNHLLPNDLSQVLAFVAVVDGLTFLIRGRMPRLF